MELNALLHYRFASPQSKTQSMDSMDDFMKV